MRVRIAAAMFAIISLSTGAGACAMSSPDPGADWCSVVDAARLPVEAGGADAICNAIRLEAEAQQLAGHFTVEVRPLSPTLLLATVTMGSGQVLPEQRLASPDRPIGPAAIARFARAVVQSVRSATEKRSNDQ